ncbi:MAG: TolC family protein [Verrucomicrobiota bacterium]
MLASAPVLIAQNEESPVPDSGPLGLSEIIQIAISNSAGVVEAEGDIQIAKAEKAAASDWRDPELRIGPAWEDSHTSTEARNRDFGARIRFTIPNIWEVRARVNKALAEVSLAEYQKEISERATIIAIRKQYGRVQFINRELLVRNELVANARNEMNRLKEAADVLELGDNVFSKASERYEDEQEDREDLIIDLDRERSQLAQLAGLDDAGRVDITSVPVTPTIEISQASISTLTAVAKRYRPEVGQLVHDIRVEEGDLQEAEAAKKPWFSFVEIGHGIGWKDGSHVNDSLEMRIGITLPFFSIFKNKQSKVHEARIRKYENMMKLAERKIETDVKTAIDLVGNSRSNLDQYRQKSVSDLAEQKRRLPEGDPASAHAIRKTTLNKEIRRLKKEEAYFESIINLEEVVGADIERAFTTEN